MRLYVCCPDSECHGFQDALNFLKSYGIEPKIKHSKKEGHYFAFKVPKGFSLSKTIKFNTELLKKVNSKDAIVCNTCKSFSFNKGVWFKCNICGIEFVICKDCIDLKRFGSKPCDCKE